MLLGRVLYQVKAATKEYTPFWLAKSLPRRAFQWLDGNQSTGVELLYQFRYRGNSLEILETQSKIFLLMAPFI